MKHIVNSVPPPPMGIISIANLPADPIIGFVKGGSKGWLQRLNYRTNEYRMFGVSCDTNNASGVGVGNGWGQPTTMEVTIKNMAKDINSNFFLFATDQELFAWLSQP